MDIEDHVGGAESDCGIGVGCKVIQELFGGCLRLLRGLGLLARDGAEGHEGGEVNPLVHDPRATCALVLIDFQCEAVDQRRRTGIRLRPACIRNEASQGGGYCSRVEGVADLSTSDCVFAVRVTSWKAFAPAFVRAPRVTWHIAHEEIVFKSTSHTSILKAKLGNVVKTPEAVVVLVGLGRKASQVGRVTQELMVLDLGQTWCTWWRSGSRNGTSEGRQTGTGKCTTRPLSSRHHPEVICFHRSAK